jgi:hypothetical protein
MTLLPPEFVAKLDEAGLTKDIRARSRQEGVDKTLDAVSAFLRSKGYNDTDIREAQQYAKQQTLSELTPA